MVPQTVNSTFITALVVRRLVAPDEWRYQQNLIDIVYYALSNERVQKFTKCSNFYIPYYVKFKAAITGHAVDMS